MKYWLVIFFCSIYASGCAQNNVTSAVKTKPAGQLVGGSCEGCKAIHESAVPFNQLNWQDSMPDFNEPGPKLIVSGTVYKNDGVTPAPGVVLYVYHTDQGGRYPMKGNEKGWGKRHGYLRGWVKTNKKGQYRFYTLRPASYPDGKNPQHIHATIKEPGINEYWIDEFEFTDDPYLTKELQGHAQNRGGSGFITTKKANGVQYAERNIFLGKNIPGYPLYKSGALQSGLKIGANLPAFDPLHLSGPDAGTHACPMCKYGYGEGVLVWFNHTNLDKIKRFAGLMENQMAMRGEKKFRVFLIYMNPTYAGNDEESEKILQSKIKKWCVGQSLKKVSMLWVPSPVDEETCGAYNINPQAENTVFVYKKRKAVAKWVNINFDEATENILSRFQ